ncbi:MAG TPA: outer membrane protein transport protein [Thermoanaerobaculia bacterium]|nr:outer membrane protein transport protein [Thermoanaerobaculia bacterium]
MDRRYRAVGMSLAVLAVAGLASAGGWKLEVMGAKALESSYAGNAASAEDASTVWFNPAGMTELSGKWTVNVAVPVINLTIDTHDDGSRSLLGQPLTGPATTDAGKVVAVPSFYAVRKLGGAWWAGLGFNTPFGLGTNYAEDWRGRYQATETTLLVYNLNPSLAWRVDDRFSVGGGVDVQYSRGVFSEMLDFGSIGAASGLPLAPQQDDGKVRIGGDAWAVGFDLGTLWKPSPATKIGLAFHSKTVHDISGSAHFRVPEDAAALTAGGTLFQNTNADAPLPMPASVSLSADQGVSRDWALLADVTWTQWSALRRITIDFDNPNQPRIAQAFDWRDVWRWSLGARYRAGEKWTVRAGAAYEQTPVVDRTREPRVPEANHEWVSAGFTYQASNKLEIDFFYVHLFTDEAKIDVSDPTAGTYVGHSDWNIDNVGVGATLRF